MFADYFLGKKVLITGHTGFKGSWLSLWLHKLQAQVFGASSYFPSEPCMFKELQIEDKMTHYSGDLKNLEFAEQVLHDSDPDIVFHLAAQAIVSRSFSEPHETIASNVMGTVNILEALRKRNKPCVVVMITSDKCYDNVEWVWGYRENDTLGGKDIYSGSKGACELLAKSYFHSYFKDSPIKMATARAGNVVGGGDWAKDRLVPDCARSWSQKNKVTIRSPHATRPWQHVLEPLSGYLTLAQHLSEQSDFVGEAFNFGPSLEKNYTVSELLKDLAGYFSFEKGEDAFNVEDQTYYEAKLLKLNCDKALFHLNWRPTLSYHELIKFIGEWYATFYQKEQKASLLDLTMNQIELYENLAKERNISWGLS